MSKDNYPKWKVVRQSDGESFLMVETNGRHVGISASELRRFLPDLYETIPYTTRQLEVMDFIKNYRHSHRISPTLEEIADKLGVTKVTAYEYINKLEEKGAIKRKRHTFRSVIPIDPNYL